jgi:hypothetical protein
VFQKYASSEQLLANLPAAHGLLEAEADLLVNPYLRRGLSANYALTEFLGSSPDTRLDSGSGIML